MSVVQREAALAYLRQFYNAREHWKFQKLRQVFLLRYIYDADVIGKEEFEMLLSYLEGLEGRARANVLEEAKKLLDEGLTTKDAISATMRGEEDEEFQRQKRQRMVTLLRARKITKALS